jgi:hypothetical protein
MVTAGAAPVECPASCGWHWATVYFSDCVCGDRDVASFLLGLASIAAWGTAELPQIWANFRAGKSEGISFMFIVTWLTVRGGCFPICTADFRTPRSAARTPCRPPPHHLHLHLHHHILSLPQRNSPANV